MSFSEIERYVARRGGICNGCKDEDDIQEAFQVRIFESIFPSLNEILQAVPIKWANCDIFQATDWKSYMWIPYQNIQILINYV